MNRGRFWIPTIIELAGISVMCFGIGYEMAYQADLGYVAISVGSAITAGGGVLYAKFRPWLEEE